MPYSAAPLMAVFNSLVAIAMDVAIVQKLHVSMSILVYPVRKKIASEQCDVANFKRLNWANLESRMTYASPFWIFRNTKST